MNEQGVLLHIWIGEGCWIMCTKGIGGRVSIDTLDQSWIEHSIDTLIDTRLTHHPHLGQQSVDSRLIIAYE